jgi:hypothetical protein
MPQLVRYVKIYFPWMRQRHVSLCWRRSGRRRTCNGQAVLGLPPNLTTAKTLVRKSGTEKMRVEHV